VNITLKKKLTAAIAAVLLVIGVQYLGMTEAAATEVSTMIAGIASAFMIGQGMADFGKEGAIATHEASNGS
jgi:hypothetical protein